MKEEEIKEIAKKWFGEGLKRADELKKWPGSDDFFEKVWLESKVGIDRLIQPQSKNIKQNLVNTKDQIAQEVKEINKKVKTFVQKSFKKSESN